MPKIYKPNKKYIQNTNIDNIYVCEPCYNYIDITKPNNLKQILRISNSAGKIHKHSLNKNNCMDTYKNPNTYTKCYICNRLVSNITNNTDIISFLEQNLNQYQHKLTDELLLKIAKYSNWYYHDIYDNFNSNLVKKFKFTRADYLNINQAMNNMEGLPSFNIINERANDLYNYLMKDTISHSIY
jgi:hypothetical protein